MFFRLNLPFFKVSYFIKEIPKWFFVFGYCGPNTWDVVRPSESLSSFESLWMWAEEYKHYTVPERVVKILIGNKSDLKKLKKVDTSDAQRFANRFSMPLWEVSTKNDNDSGIIETIFSTLAEKLLKDKPATSLIKSPVLRGSTLRPKSIQEETVKLKHGKAKLEKEKKTCCNVK